MSIQRVSWSEFVRKPGRWVGSRIIVSHRDFGDFLVIGEVFDAMDGECRFCGEVGSLTGLGELGFHYICNKCYKDVIGDV